MIVSGHGESAGSRRARISTTTDRTGRGDIDLILGDEDWSRIRASMVCVMTSQCSYLLCTGSRGSELREHGNPLGVPHSAGARNVECIRIGEDFMVSHGYIHNDFDVDEWVRQEFLEQAAEEVLKEEWQRRSWS
jgi:hypothetical protein